MRLVIKLHKYAHNATFEIQKLNKENVNQAFILTQKHIEASFTIQSSEKHIKQQLIIIADKMSQAPRAQIKTLIKFGKSLSCCRIDAPTDG